MSLALTARNTMSRKNQSFSGHGGQEREHFAKVVYTSLSKVINNKEVPPKQKHVRIAVMSTHKERAASTYWGIVTTMGLQGNDLTAYKFCHVTHCVLRDGHPNVLPESAKHIPFLDNLSRLWSNMADGYGRTTAFYCDLLVTKIKFHERNPAFPGNLQFEDIATFENEYLSYPDNLFNLCAELFDYLEAVLSLQVQIFNLVERGRWGTASAQSQCLLSPLVPIIQDACQLYDLIVRSMYKLHSSIPSDLLQGHSQRFNQMFPTTKNFFLESARLTYVKSFMQLPSLNAAPDFSRVASTLASKQHYAPVKMIAQPEEDDYYYEDSSSSTLPSNVNDTLIEFEPTPLPDFNGAVGMDPSPPALIPRSSPATLLGNLNDAAPSIPTRSPPPIPPMPPTFAAVDDSRLLDKEKEIARLRSEVEFLTDENGQLREENQKREDEVNEQINEIHINFLQIKAENQQLKKSATEGRERVEQLEQELQLQREQLEAQLKASSDKFTKMTDIYAKLREEHLTVLRSKGELQRQLNSLGEKARTAPAVEQSKQEELEKLKLEISLLHQQLAELEETNANSRTDLQQTKLLHDQLQSTLNASKDECSTLQDKIEKLKTLVIEFVRSTLMHVETPSIVIPNVTPDVLVATIDQVITEWDKNGSGEDYVQQWVRIAFKLNDSASLIASVLQFYPITAKVRENFISCVQKCATCFENYLDKRSPSKPLCNGEDTLISFGEESSEEGAPQCLRDLLQLSKEVESGETASESAAPSAADLEKILEDEMRTASRAIDDASSKFQDLLRQSSTGDDDVKLQVHTTVLESCTKLMTLIKRLMIAVKVMQDQMVAKGECKSSKDFYAKNSVWTEGLISGGKSLGLSATMLLEAADSAVKGSGSFVALKACGKGIISATAHLLMAAKVKGLGDRVSGEKELQTLAKQVQSATGEVIASAQQAQQLQDDKMLMDFSGLSLHQAKQMEMESHIKLLELEASVQRERSRLGDLRRRHYELAAAASKPMEDTSASEQPEAS